MAAASRIHQKVAQIVYPVVAGAQHIMTSIEMEPAMRMSAGIISYRRRHGKIEVFLVHPGGPFWKNKDVHAWSIPKGEFVDENPLLAARREFKEETGQDIEGKFSALAPVRSSGKVIHAFAVECADLDPNTIRSNPFELEWPPRSGRRQSFPEVDRAEWFPLEQAARKIHKNQQAVLEKLVVLLEGADPSRDS